ncbi:hypothetical protein EDB84DRAFT_1510180, partial [Lactarius hengduanensis]
MFVFGIFSLVYKPFVLGLLSRIAFPLPSFVAYSFSPMVLLLFPLATLRSLPVLNDIVINFRNHCVPSLLIMG